jgi:hypothetical protein
MEDSFDLLAPEANTSNFLYHYTTAEKMLLYILPQKRLRFFPLTKTNDPMEKRRYVRQLTFDIDIPTESEILQAKERVTKISNDIQKDTYILCFAQDSNETCKDTFYLDRGFGKPRMWAQYANNHTGACLIFNKSKLCNYFETLFSGQIHFSEEIIYTSFLKTISVGLDAVSVFASELSQSDETIVLEKINKHYKKYYFTKHNDWEAENEYRMLVRQNSVEQIFIDIDGALDYIVLGNDFDMNLMPLVNSLWDSFLHKPTVIKPKFY